MRSDYTTIISILVLLLGLLFDLYQQGLIEIPQRGPMQQVWLRRLALFKRTSTCQPVTHRFTSTTTTSSAVMSSDLVTKTDESPLGLPEPSEELAHKLDLSSGQDSISMDHLGPLVVNKDGTLSRISNWAQMTEMERKNTLRVLSKRNQLRTKDLKAKEAEEVEGGAA